MHPTAAAGLLDAFFPGPSPAYVPANLRVKLRLADGSFATDASDVEVVAVVPNDGSTWADADGPVKSGVANFGPPAGAWSDGAAIVGWALFDDDTDLDLGVGRRFSEARVVAAADPEDFVVRMDVTQYDEPGGF